MARTKIPTHTDAQINGVANEICSFALDYETNQTRKIDVALIEAAIISQSEVYNATEKAKIRKIVRKTLKDCGYTLVDATKDKAEDYLANLNCLEIIESVIPVESRDWVKTEKNEMQEKYPRIDDETAKELLKKHHEAVANGDKKAARYYRDQVANPFFYLIIPPLYNHNLLGDENSKQDRIHDAFLKLYEAIEKYDFKVAAERNCKVITYLARRIHDFARLLVLKMMNEDPLIKVPGYIYTEISKINRFVNEFRANNGCEPTDNIIKSQMGYKDNIWANIQAVRYHTPLSLDAVTEDNTSLSDIIPAEYDLEGQYEANEMANAIHTILRNNDIPMRSRMMIMYKYGFIDSKAHTNKETGEWIAKYNGGKKVCGESVRKCIQPALAILAEYAELKNYR